MPLLEKYLVVKRSTLKGAGKGLFTTKDIARGTKITEYRGKVTTWKEVDDKNGLNGYIYYVNSKYVIDASEQKQELARYANDARGLVRTEGIRNNCTYNMEGVRVYIVAMRNIPAGSELLVGYGKEYWDIIKENWANKVKEEAKAERAKAKAAGKAGDVKAATTRGAKTAGKKAAGRKTVSKKGAAGAKKTGPSKKAGRPKKG